MSAKASVKDDQVTALGLYHYAGSYHGSALALLSVKPKVTHPEAPTNFLFFHAMELYLKSFLRQEGVPVAELASRKFGHNLKQLANEAKSRGLSLEKLPETFLTGWVISDDAMLSRYIVTGKTKAVPGSTFVEVCADLRNAIGKHLVAQRVVPPRSIAPFKMPPDQP